MSEGIRKAPPSAYKQFVADHIDEIREIWKKENEESKQEGKPKTTLFETMSAEWKRLPAEVRQQYNSEAKERMKKYQENSPFAW
ncbi:Oidioi.mRNA.OKI2018_I69.XSR.g15814.t1.cds [Oikopleura dioica]|uniref:Oidioi.mRNA.OKI2018_I69.XSR.g15814.t1.cds n=1 Tax=Oikopleura dioica TaxID=34765 RepID=A0ABN7SI09_OIKDI|nr:Oidioi.mRNA.OKI2018_I69.XSR.g15814.t1.cds [Oikopleura dioica]